MEIDLEKMKTDGQNYIDSLIETLKETDWENLRSTKLANCKPEELALMKTLWSHGFMAGAERAIEMSESVYNQVNKK